MNDIPSGHASSAEERAAKSVRKEITVDYWNTYSGRYMMKPVPWVEYVRLFREGLLKFQKKQLPKPEHYPSLEEALAFAAKSDQGATNSNDAYSAARERSVLQEVMAPRPKPPERAPVVTRQERGFRKSSSPALNLTRPTVPTVKVPPKPLAQKPPVPKAPAPRQPPIARQPLKPVVQKQPAPTPTEIKPVEKERSPVVDWQRICANFDPAGSYGISSSKSSTLFEVVCAITYMHEVLGMSFGEIGGHLNASSHGWSYMTYRLRNLHPGAWKYVYPELPRGRSLTRTQLDTLAKRPKERQLELAEMFVRARLNNELVEVRRLNTFVSGMKEGALRFSRTLTEMLERSTLEASDIQSFREVVRSTVSTLQEAVALLEKQGDKQSDNK